ncbi:hypothetical protein CVT25_003834 [Psilocybe cyanescens]|uniref:Uncharacterized protein n=1 Tax=Psilocybe cyanescens TaxID=93625 RepID=A0A409XPZ4_PSICY|nr:hypothetical protein CVT25_003834 [Psilocybe cyanescens]
MDSSLDADADVRVEAATDRRAVESFTVINNQITTTSITSTPSYPCPLARAPIRGAHIATLQSSIAPVNNQRPRIPQPGASATQSVGWCVDASPSILGEKEMEMESGVKAPTTKRTSSSSSSSLVNHIHTDVLPLARPRLDHAPSASLPTTCVFFPAATAVGMNSTFCTRHTFRTGIHLPHLSLSSSRSCKDVSRDVGDDDLDGSPAPAPCPGTGATIAPLPLPLISGAYTRTCKLPAVPALYEADGVKLSDRRFNFKFFAERSVDADAESESEEKEVEVEVDTSTAESEENLGFLLCRLNGRICEEGMQGKSRNAKRGGGGGEGEEEREEEGQKEGRKEGKGGRRQQIIHPSFDRTICDIRSFIL